MILRLLPVILTRGLGIGLDDMFQYDMLARSLAEGNGFRWYARADVDQLAPFVDFDLTSVQDYDPILGVPTSFRAPLYPAFLALVYFFNGTGFSRFFAARLAQALLLSAPLAPLTYLVSRRLFPGEEKAARISAWMIAGYPILLVYPLGLGTENPFFILLLVSFLLLLNSSITPSTSLFLLSGFLLGLTALTRSVIVPFVGLAILWVWFPLKDRRGAILIALSFTLTLAPWVIRNSLLHDRLTGVETSMGYNLYLGYHPQGNGSFVFGPSLDLLTILDDAERDKTGTQQAIGFIKAAPQRVIPLAVARLGYFFGLEKRVLMYFYSNDILGFIPLPVLLTVSGIFLLPFVGISVSSALGISLLRREPGHILLVLLFLGYTLPHVFILSEDRFHLALVPYLAILAAQFWSGGWIRVSSRWRSSPTGKVLAAVSLLCVILLLTNWGLELDRDWDKITQLVGPNGNRSYFPY